MKLRQFSPLGRKMGSGCMKSSALAMLGLLGSLSINFQEDLVSDVAAAFLKNTHLGEKGKELREQEQKRLKNEERLKNEKICKVSLPFAPFHLYSITTSPSFRLLHLAVTG